MVLTLGADGGELVTVLGEEILEDGLGALDAGGVVLAFDGEADLGFLEALGDIRQRDGVVAGVVQLADGGLFLDVDDELDAGGGVDALDADVFEVAGVPERVEVALDDGRVVQIAGAREEPGDDGFLGDAAVADDVRGAECLGVAVGGLVGCLLGAWLRLPGPASGRRRR